MDEKTTKLWEWKTNKSKSAVKNRKIIHPTANHVKKNILTNLLLSADGNAKQKVALIYK